jgi:hypothetical protein
MSLEEFNKRFIAKFGSLDVTMDGDFTGVRNTYWTHNCGKHDPVTKNGWGWLEGTDKLCRPCFYENKKAAAKAAKPGYNPPNFDSTLEKAKIKYNNRYTYVVPENSHTLRHSTIIEITCTVHNQTFSTSLVNHAVHQIHGGCTKCRYENQVTDEEYQIRIDNKLSNTPEILSVLKLTTKYHPDNDVEIECKLHGKSITTLGKFLGRAKPCVKCRPAGPSPVDLIVKDPDIQNVIDIASDKFDNNYEYDITSTLSNPSSSDIINIRCKLHDVTISNSMLNHVNSKTGLCKDCGQDARVKGKQKPENELIDMIDKVIADNSNIVRITKLDDKYTLKGKVEIECKIHGCETIDLATVIVHRKKGCFKCCFDGTKKIHEKSQDDFDVELRKTKPDIKYDLLEEWRGNSTLVRVYCGNVEHDPEDRKASALLGKYACLQCAYSSPHYKQMNIKSYDDWLKEATAMYGTRFTYELLEEWRGVENTKIKVTCPDHPDANDITTPTQHLRRSNGCVDCSFGKQVSDGELEWFFYLSDPNIITQYKVPNSGRAGAVDGYDPTTNTLFMYHGTHWHGDFREKSPSDVNKNNGMTYQELNDRTKRMEQKYLDMGYNLKIIWEIDWNNFKQKNRITFDIGIDTTGKKKVIRVRTMRYKTLMKPLPKLILEEIKSNRKPLGDDLFEW